MPILRPYAVGYPMLVILLAFLGMLLAIRRRWREALPPLLFSGTVVAGGLAFYGSPRMRAPMEPMLMVSPPWASPFSSSWLGVVSCEQDTVPSHRNSASLNRDCGEVLP